MKKLKFLFTALLLLCCVGTAKAEDFAVNGIFYNITDSNSKTVEVTYKGSYYEQYYNEYSGSVTIPKIVSYNGNTYNVTSIGDRAFCDCSGLTSITIPNSVTSIGWFAFCCTGITSITIPNSVTSIGYEAFYGCSGLTSITIPSSVTSIEGAFNGCSGLTSIEIPNSVTSIGEYAFNGCSGLTSIIIPNSVTSIGEHAFKGCSGLTSITIPNSVTSIGIVAFDGCSSLTSITIPNSVTSIGDWAFYDCTRLKTVINLSNLKFSKGSTDYGYIAYYADKVISGEIENDFIFGVIDGVNTLIGYLGNETELILPADYKGESYVIGENVFKDNKTITSITIPNSVTSIGEGAFFGCTELKKVINFSNLIFAKGSDSYGHVAYYADWVVSAPDITIVDDFGFYEINGVNTLCKYQGNGIEVTLPEKYNGGNYVIGKEVFNNCKDITSITIPNSVTSIEEKAFYGCSNLHSVTIGSGVLSIGSNAFNNPEKVIWLTNTPPTGYANAEGKINYVSNNEFTNLHNVYVYPYLSSKLEVDGIIYVLNPAERTCDAIDCAYNSTAEKINIGETISYRNIEMTVKTVMPYACYGNSYIKEVEISNNGDIKEQAFYNCDNLQTVTVSNNGNIGEQAFYDCNNIKSVEITNVINIESNAFEGCSNLPKIIIPNSVESIGAYSFKGCTALNNVTLGENVTTINDNTFENCSSLPEITIPATVTTIANNVFKGCSKLADVIIANSTNELSLGSNGSSPMFADCPLDSVYVGAKLRYNTSPFYNNKSLRTIVFADKETNIYEREFDGCSALENITLGNGITEIGNYAFIGCIALPNIVIPNSVTSLGAYSFKGCTTLNSVTLGENITAINDNTFESCTNLPKIVIPNSVKSIGAHSFKGCTALNSVTLGENVTAINNNAFESCTNLPNIVIPNSVESIGAYSFKDCTALNNVTLGENVTTINDNAFENCSLLPKITIPASVTAIANNVFKGCSKLADVIIANSTNELSLGSNGSSPMFADCPLDSVYVGAKLRYNTSPFYNNKSLRTVVFGNKETNIYEREFAGCSALKNITLGNGITNIGNYAFENCSLLPEITIPAPVATVANNVFKGCSKLADVIIADRKKELSLGSNGSSPLFVDCPLDSVYIGGEITYNTSSEYGYSPFYRNTSLRSVVISDLATKVYTNEFYGCTALTDVIVGHNVNTIGDYAFSACSSLNAFTFGSSIEEIGDEAFSDCVKLTSITSYATIPPVCGTQALQDINVFDCSLYVPSGYAQAYQQAEQWKNFFFVDDPINIYTLTLVVDGEIYHSIKLPYNAKILMPEPTKEGYAFSGWIGAPETMPKEDITVEGTFTINNYSITYKIDGTETTESLTYGAELVIPEAPAKEGYTFNGWYISGEEKTEIANKINIKDNADAMLYTNAPCTNAQYGDQFTSWNVLFDGDANTFFHSEYGNKQTPDALDHYIRVDMGEGKEIGEFKFTYTTRYDKGGNVMGVSPKTIVVEGSNSANGNYTVIATLNNLSNAGSHTYTSDILGNADTKYRYIRYRVTENHSGQKDNNHPYFAISEFGMERIDYVYDTTLPQTMPAKDIVIVGTYTRNSYNVTYMVADEVYQTVAVEYGTKIPTPNIPETDGYTFNSWENVPETMPAEDIVIYANINTKSYNVTYIVDGKTEKTVPVAFGTKIPLLENTSNWQCETPINIKDNADAMLYTNAPCTNTSWGDQFTSWTVLFDDNTNTIFHSEYGNKQTPDGLDHYIRVDMGEGKNINKFKFTYTTRNLENNNNVSPKRIVVEGSNSANGSYTTIATLENLPSAKETVYTSEVMGSENTAYRYIRYRVIETHGNSKDNEHPYFAIAEFGMTKVEELPLTMPAKDIIIAGKACTEVHTLTYVVDGKTYKTETVGCNAVITPLEAPVKEGYTFSGWSEIPEIMPAENITVTGTFTVNTYTVTYIVDGEIYKIESVVYNDEIPAVEEPEKEGYIFSGWSEIPETMPAEDITITGSFALDNTTAIDEVRGNNEIVVYDLNGNRILDTENLERGVYIINGIKVLVK